MKNSGLQACRKAAGWKSAREFAEHIGMPVGTYTNYEQGKRELGVSVAWDLADALGCTIDQIAGREGVEYMVVTLEDDGDDQA